MSNGGEYYHGFPVAVFDIKKNEESHRLDSSCFVRDWEQELCGLEVLFELMQPP